MDAMEASDERLDRPDPGCVYFLIDPRDAAIRYIGQTGDTIRHRLISHKANKKGPVGKWIQELANLRMTPVTMAAEQTTTKRERLIRESHYFALGMFSGWDLLNDLFLPQSLRCGCLGCAYIRRKLWNDAFPWEERGVPERRYDTWPKCKLIERVIELDELVQLVIARIP